MKILFFTLLVSLLTINSWGQKLTASVQMDSKEFLTEANKGHFQWILPVSLTKAEIEKSASYYESAFIFTYDEKKNSIDVYSLNNTDDDRKIMLRFLGANQIQTIIYNNVNYELYDFYNSYMSVKK